MKLHLGCGRVIFPADPDAAPAHLYPLPESAFEPGWVNVDRVAGAGIGEVVDLFRFPWVRSSNGAPWNDSTVDEIYASHLVEHIPHAVHLAAGLPPSLAGDYGKLVDRLDGWFVFFYECWRLLKPGGLMHVVTPWGLSVGGITDPSHTRYILPGAFQYLQASDPGAPFDYGVPCAFEIDPPLLRISDHWLPKLTTQGPDGPVLPDAEGLTRLAVTYFDVASELRMELRAVKG